MNEKVAQYRARVSQYWSQSSKKQRIMLFAIAGIIIVSIILMVAIFSKTEYVVAFKELDTADAGAIMEYLDGNGIAYQLSSDGKSISVPTAVASKVKVDVGSQGIMKNGSSGLSIFGERSSAFGQTDNEFNAVYRNAINGEIQKLFTSLEGIQRAQVFVTLPEESIFARPEEQQRALASLTLAFQSGFTPTQEDIDGYFNLVKTAVPNLSVDDTTIWSEKGELFPSSRLQSNLVGTTQSAQNQFQVQRDYENELRRTIQQYLGRMFGYDELAVYVSSTMNFDQKNSVEQLVKPLDNNNNNGIIISEESNSKTATGQEASAAGVAGTGETDVPGYQAEGPGSSSLEEISRVTNYDVSRITNEIVSAPFVVKDLMISVGINKETLTDDENAVLSNTISAIVRGQLIDSGQNVEDDALIAKKFTIFAQPFKTASSEGQSGGLSTGWMIGIGAGVALLAVAAAVYMAAARRRKAAEQAAIEAEMMQPVKLELPTIDLENVTNDSQVRKQLEQLAKRKPDDFVNLLRTWLVDE